MDRHEQAAADVAEARPALENAPMDVDSGAPGRYPETVVVESSSASPQSELPTSETIILVDATPATANGQVDDDPMNGEDAATGEEDVVKQDLRAEKEEENEEDVVMQDAEVVVVEQAEVKQATEEPTTEQDAPSPEQDQNAEIVANSEDEHEMEAEATTNGDDDVAPPQTTALTPRRSRRTTRSAEQTVINVTDTDDAAEKDTKKSTHKGDVVEIHDSDYFEDVEMQVSSVKRRGKMTRSKKASSTASENNTAPPSKARPARSRQTTRSQTTHAKPANRPSRKRRQNFGRPDTDSSGDSPSLSSSSASASDSEPEFVPPKAISASKRFEDEVDRACDFCQRKRNICSLAHCSQCKRMYHAKCFVSSFKEYCKEDVPIESQLNELAQAVPGHRANIFRCESCSAAFVEYYKCEPYMWDCKCRTCDSDPDLLIKYRKFSVVRMMREFNEEKDAKKKAKQGGSRTNGSGDTKAGGQAQASAKEPQRTSYRTRNADARPSLTFPGTEAAATNGSQDLEYVDVDMAADDEPEQELEALDSQQTQPKQCAINAEGMKDQWMVEDLLIKCNDTHCVFNGAFIEKNEENEAKIIKKGVFDWSYGKAVWITCECCHQKFKLVEFCEHASDRFLGSETKDQMAAYLCVLNRDGDESESKPYSEVAAALDRLCARLSKKDAVQADDDASEFTIHSITRAREETSVMEPSPVQSFGGSIDVSGVQFGVLRRVNLDHVINGMKRLMPTLVIRVVCTRERFMTRMTNHTMKWMDKVGMTTIGSSACERKSGLLYFTLEPLHLRYIICDCCQGHFDNKAFAEHAEVRAADSDWDVRKCLYIATPENNIFVLALDFVRIFVDMNAKNALHEVIDPSFLKDDDSEKNGDDESELELSARPRRASARQRQR